MHGLHELAGKSVRASGSLKQGTMQTVMDPLGPARVKSNLLPTPACNPAAYLGATLPGMRSHEEVEVLKYLAAPRFLAPATLSSEPLVRRRYVPGSGSAPRFTAARSGSFLLFPLWLGNRTAISILTFVGYENRCPLCMPRLG